MNVCARILIYSEQLRRGYTVFETSTHGQLKETFIDIFIFCISKKMNSTYSHSQCILYGWWRIDPPVLPCLLHFIERFSIDRVYAWWLVYIYTCVCRASCIRASPPWTRKQQLLRQRLDDGAAVTWLSLTWFNLNLVSHLAPVEYSNGR